MLEHEVDGRFTLRNVREHSLLESLVSDVRTGLVDPPRWLPPKWFYDATGSALFDEITRLPEYYPTRREREVLREHADEAVRVAGADVLVELGSGTSDKTRTLLDALARAGRLERFVPVDVDPTVLESAGHRLLEDYPGLRVDALCADFETDLGHLPGGGRQLVAFLGGTVGNLPPELRARFLKDLHTATTDDSALLLGVDLVKDERRLVVAYDDAAGVTARFDLNVLSVLNDRLGADFQLSCFAHRAVWDAGRQRIEMRLRSLAEQTVHVPGADVVLQLAAGEELLTEVSCKFRRRGLEDELRAAGWEPARWWTDRHGDFGVSLAVRS